MLYTSDGRDVEMSVASTKAFYSQVAAGFLLAQAVAAEVGGTVDQAVLEALRDLPTAMAEVLARRETIAEAAHSLAPPKRYWAVVGNGVNRIAAAEVRIKLSELCYKSIACDRTEDKKHIDLSAEPLILVCAAGLTGSTADDVAKEVAIYRAHKASPIVIATDGQARYAAALAVLPVPETHPQLAFVLSAMAGHLFGYEAALAIDALAHPLRRTRAAVETVVGADADVSSVTRGDTLLKRLRPHVEPTARSFFDSLRVGRYDGHLEASTAVRLGTLFRYALGSVPLDSYQLDEGKVGTPAVVVDDLTAGLTRAIEELTRPIDAIKHQAKTVTVGISRTDETLLEVPLVAAVLAAGAPRDQLSYKVLRTLADVSPGDRRGAGVDPLPGREPGHARRPVDDRPGRPGRHRPRHGQPHRPLARAAGHQAPGGQRARGPRRPGPARQPADRDRPRGEGRAVDRHHPPPRALRRPPARGHGPGGAAGLPQPLRGAARRGARDRAHVPGGRAGHGAGRRPAHRADQPARRPLACRLTPGPRRPGLRPARAPARS